MTVLDKALIYAVKAHAGAVRKGGNTPYIVHPIEVAAMAARMTDDLEVIAAAALHDVIEDTSVTAEELESEFGARVVKLVLADSEDKRADRPAAETWEIRKRETLDLIESMSREEQIVVLADKLSNLRSINDDYSKIGDEVWNRFNQKDRKKHAWYYSGVAERLDKLKGTNAFKDYEELLFEVFGAEVLASLA